MNRLKALLLTFLIATTYAHSEIPKVFNYINLTPAEGYPSVINDINIEDYGFVWIASNDGLYQLTNDRVLRHTKETYHSYNIALPGDNVLTHYTDSHNTGWVLTTKGVMASSREEGTHALNRIKGLDGIIAYSICESENGVMLGGVNRIWEYNHEEKKLVELVSFETPQAFKVDQILKGQGGDYFLFNSEGQIMHIYNSMTKSIRKFKGPWKPTYFKAFVDSKYRIWISDFNNGVLCINSLGEKLAEYNKSNSAMRSNIVLCYLEKNGYIWMGMHNGGVTRLNPDNGRVAVLWQDPQYPSSMPSNTIKALASDSSGNIWCGRAHGGIFLIAQTEHDYVHVRYIRPVISTNGFYSFYQDKYNDKEIWAGTSGGGIILCTRRIGYEFDTFDSTANMDIYSIAGYDREHLAIYSSSEGFIKFNKETGETGPADYVPRDKNYIIGAGSEGYDICNDEKGRVISITDTLFVFDPKTKKLSSYNLPKNEGSQVMSISGSEGHYYFDDSRLYYFDEERDPKIAVIYNTENLSAIKSATMGFGKKIWLALDEGIHYYDIQKSELVKVDAHLGTSPNSLICDNKGRVWIGTTGKTFCYDPIARTLSQLGPVNGVADNEYFHHAKLLTKNNNILLGGVDGFTFLNGDFNFPVYRDPDIVLYQISLNSKDLSDFRNLTLSANTGAITLQFFAKSHDILVKRFYKFRVEGPHYCKEEIRKNPYITLRSPEPGTHRITISCTTSDGRWSEPKEVFSFKVKKPWYMTWYTHLIFLLITFLLLYGAYHLIVRIAYANKDKMNESQRYNFLLNVSHELRTPLTLIIGPLNRILKKEEITNEDRKSLANIYRQADRMKNLLNTVLTISKIQDESGSINLKAVRLNEWVSENAGEYEDEARGSDMDIVVKTDPRINVIKMDPYLTKIVFSNIMMNAVKRNPSGSPIRVETQLENGFAKIMISDRGASVDEKNMLDGRFYQQTEEKTGYGVGLSYSKAIINRQGGEIACFNNIGGNGATFWFTLPLEENAHEYKSPTAEITEKQEDIHDEPAQGVQRKTENLSVLFVDDDIDLRNYMKDMLSERRIRVILAKNGMEALNMISTKKPDIVVSDVMMPEMDGMTLCGRIKENPETKDIPVVLLTERADRVSRDEGFSREADYYLAKPFDIEELIEIIKKAIDKNI